METYIFDPAWQAERDRLESLQDLYDANSARCLAACGLDAGWQCLEVGCGAGGLARWLADRVGPTGRVVATDLDTRFVAEHGRDNLEVRQHDIVSGPLDAGRFDLVHARVGAGLLSEEELAAFLAVTARPDSWYLPPVMVTAWGRRPA